MKKKKNTTKHRLTAREVQTLGLGKHADGGGLYLIVEASGARRWLFRYTAGGKRRDQGFGSTAKVSLARAREKAAEATALLARGIDPLNQREEQRAAEKAREHCQFNSARFCWPFDAPAAVTPPPCPRRIPSVHVVHASRRGSADVVEC